MELLKLAGIFISIVLILKLRKNLSLAIGISTLVTALLFQLPLESFVSVVSKSVVSSSTLTILLVFYLVGYLQRMLEARGSLRLAQSSLDGIFKSRRITTALAPFLLGLLPSPSVVLMAGDIVNTSVEDHLNDTEKAFVTSFYRHIPESFLPMFSTILIAINLTEGRIELSSFMLAMVPMILVMMALGHLFYLRRIPKEIKGEHLAFDQSIKRLIQGSWPIALIILWILVLNRPVYEAAIGSIIIFALVGRFRAEELKHYVFSAFEKNLMLSTFFIMIFKDVLMATNVINTLPALFANLPISDALIFALIFFVGTLVGGSQAITVIALPLVFLTIPDAGLPIFILVIGMAFIANQLSPTHVCLPITAEYFKIDFSSLIKESLPTVAAYIVLLYAYYHVLSFIL